MGNVLIDLTGQTFGELVVLGKTDLKSKRGAQWTCLCSCGRVVDVWSIRLRSNHTRSCGCWCRKGRKERMTKHGMNASRPYSIWEGMWRRCSNPNAFGYEYYGGRGIVVDPAWSSFEVFWGDMQDGYEDHLTIERVDNHGAYTKSNCRWATRKEQSNNTRANNNITFNGDTKTLTEWAECLGMEPKTLDSRIFDYGWSVERAFTEPVHSCGRKRTSGRR